MKRPAAPQIIWGSRAIAYDLFCPAKLGKSHICKINFLDAYPQPTEKSRFKWKRIFQMQSPCLEVFGEPFGGKEYVALFCGLAPKKALYVLPYSRDYLGGKFKSYFISPISPVLFSKQAESDKIETD